MGQLPGESVPCASVKGRRCKLYSSRLAKVLLGIPVHIDAAVSVAFILVFFFLNCQAPVAATPE